MVDGGMEEKCVFNRSGDCYFLESKVETCHLCFNFKTFTMVGKKRKLYYNIFDYLKESGLGDTLFPRDNSEQDSLKNL